MRSSWEKRKNRGTRERKRKGKEIKERYDHYSYFPASAQKLENAKSKY